MLPDMVKVIYIEAPCLETLATLHVKMYIGAPFPPCGSYFMVFKPQIFKKEFESSNYHQMEHSG